ncbi:MAG: LamG domain-containing protein [Nannocystis sp.]|nr:LamG domain-containing protein [Nannocystis sp.]
MPRQAFLFYVTDDSHRRQLCASVPWSDGNVYFDGAADASNKFNRIVKALSPLDDQRTWNHWAFIYDQPQARMSIYKNGVRWWSEQGKATRPMAPCNRLVIGADGDAKGHFAGAICEVRLWSVTRTSTQIRENMVRRIPGADDGLIASYALDQFVQAGQSIPDRSGGGRNGVLRGTTVWALKPGALL